MLPQFNPITSDEASEPSLIARAKVGDADAIRALYERYAPQLQHSIAARLSDPVQVEDICADVFVKVLESLSRYEERGWPFAAWLYRIAYARTADVLRQSGRSEDAQIALPNRQVTPHPPKYRTVLLRHLPEEIREIVIGDLEEEFYTKIDTLGQIQANIWYTQQTISSFWIFAVHQAKKCIKQRVIGWVNEVFRRLT